jgi:hypothetical protein
LDHEALDIGVVQSEERGHRGGWTIAERDPYHLRRRAASQAKAKEILIARYEDTCMLDGEHPNRKIGCSSVPQRSYVKRIGIEVLQCRDQGLGEILVEEKPHWRLRGGDRQNPSLPLGGERQARQHVLVSQLGEICQELGLRGPGGEVAQNLPDGDSGAADAGLAEANILVDGYALKLIHGNMIRR